MPILPLAILHGVGWVLAPVARRAVRTTAHGGRGKSCSAGETMVGAGVLAATLLMLVPVTGFPILGRLPVFGELWPGPSAVERTKRSTKGENVQISVAFLKHLTSALVACATIFGMTISVLSLAACYLYYKRRQLKPFLDVVLRSGESLHRSKSNDPNCCTPISLSQAFHFGQSQESSKNQTAMATDSKTSPRESTRSSSAESPCKIKRTDKPCPKEEPDLTIKEIYASSDIDCSSNGSQLSFTVRSKTYLFPSWSSESMGSLFDEDACDAFSAQLSSSDEIMENEFSQQPTSNTNQKENSSIAVVHHSCKYQDHSSYSDELLLIKKVRISKSKSENDMYVSSSKELRPVRSFTIFEGRHNT
ncbi:uncharacterized protein LOC125432564 isoform X2 [Sphaerodactylus townsendi]|uniref:uncharacterized protein LOC125432564 isoform X2 n=1 Tax=Sphaerodactylus townsendi TaxID=933632 RepID=UPI00202768F2|nr:uncharacterized protein LOC125432564 isoform X2 [Sphaerodactylus townsendi]